MHFLAKLLFAPKTIESEIIRINEKHRAEGKDLLLKSEGVELANIAQNAKDYAKIFAEDLKSGVYKIQPARLVDIEVAGKVRTLYLFGLNDSILHGVISNIVHDHCQKNFSPNLKSYLKGRSHWKTLKEFEAFVRKYYQSDTPLLKKGLYLLRRDIASYTDRIPVHDESLLWPLLKKEIDFPDHPSSLEARAWDYMKQVIQTEADCPTRGVFRKETGVPTGSPISTTLFNVYMVELDRSLDNLHPKFYTRYGDDIIVADTDKEITNKASIIIKDVLDKYSLESNKKKLESYYFNNAGRHPNIIYKEGEERYPGRDRILFLGCEIKANGTVSLSKKNKNNLLQDIQTRLLKIPQNLPPSRRLDLICRAVQATLDPTQPLCHKTALLLRYNINDRHCLKELDKRIALKILQSLLGRDSPKGFKTFPIRIMREKGLPSLVHLRNLEK